MIIIKTSSQIDGIRKSCRIVAYVLKALKAAIKPGITTNFLDKMAEDLCVQKGGIPGFKGYKGFPYSICASKNEEVVHGFPNDIPLQEGDIISIDFGVVYKGWYGDSAFSAGVGKISTKAEHLLQTGRNCLNLGIKEAQAYGRIGNVSNAIQEYAEKQKYGVVREFVGHGIGKNLHEEPYVPNWGSKGVGYMLKPGMVIAIEPMITEGSQKVKQLSDGWTNVTVDGKLAVHFEHTVAILPDGPEILTKIN